MHEIRYHKFGISHQKINLHHFSFTSFKMKSSPFLESGAAAGVSKCLTEQTTTATVKNEEEHQELL